MNKVPPWFFIVAVIALLWNLIGAVAVIANFMLTPEQAATLPSAEQQLYADIPVWSSYFSLLALIAGSVGCIGLLLKKLDPLGYIYRMHNANIVIINFRTV